MSIGDYGNENVPNVRQVLPSGSAQQGIGSDVAGVLPDLPQAGIGGTVGSTLPDCCLLPDRYREQHKCCCDSGYPLLAEAIEHLAEILVSLESAISANITAGMDYVSKFAGQRLGECHCLCDDAQQAASKLTQKIQGRMHETMQEALGYAARLGVYPRTRDQVEQGEYPQSANTTQEANASRIVQGITPGVSQSRIVQPTGIGTTIAQGMGEDTSFGGKGLDDKSGGESWGASAANKGTSGQYVASQGSNIYIQQVPGHPCHLVVNCLTTVQFQQLIDMLQMIALALLQTPDKKIGTADQDEDLNGQDKDKEKYVIVHEAPFVNDDGGSYKVEIIGAEPIPDEE